MSRLMHDKYLAHIDAQHLTRRIATLGSGVHPVVNIAGRQVLLLASNDYLGLAGHHEVIQAAIEATHTYGAGTGAARLVSGSLPPHVEMEQALAQFKGTATALAFGSGYLANVGTIPSLIGRGDLILADPLHASLIMVPNAKRTSVYSHNDMDHLKTLISDEARSGEHDLTDAVFSMTGLAPLMSTSLAQLFVPRLHDEATARV